MTPRTWLILLDLDGGSEHTVHATVDDDILLPGKSYRQPSEALQYIDQVLADFRTGDEITLMALNAPEPIAAWTTRVRSVAVQWCAIVLSRVDLIPSAGEPRKLRDLS